MLIRCATLFMIMFVATPAAQAQSLSGLQVGDDSARVQTLGDPNDTGTYKKYALRKWRLPNGNDISVSVQDDGKLAYIETDWNFTESGATTEMFGFTFGRTSLTDIRAKLGSNGMAFRGRASVGRTPAGLVMMNAYEVGQTMVTFITLVPPADFDKASEGEPANYAMLVAISMASPAYAAEEWGERLPDDRYRALPAP
jgi:hypothetical protein